MKSLKDVQNIVANFNVEPESDMRSKVLNEALRNQHSRNQQGICDKFTLRIIMKSKTAKYAMAAMIIVAVLAGYYQITGSIDGTSVTWAGVVEKCHSFKTVTYTQTIDGSFFHQEKEYDSMQIKHSLAFSKHKTTREVGNSRRGDKLILTESIIDENNHMIFIDHEAKSFYRQSSPGARDDEMLFISKLKSLPLQADEVIGKKVIKGEKTLGFLVKGNGIDLKLWVHDETNNPILIEYIDNDSPEFEMVFSDFRFDTKIDESQFNVQLPPGYSIMDPSVIPMHSGQGTVNDFIYYLKLYAKYSEDGSFPDKISIAKDKEGLFASVSLRPIESAKCTDSELKEMSVKGPRSYQFLNQMKPENDWYYAGKGILPSKLDTPVCWWKDDGSEYYTVIFADLSIGTFTEEELPE